jgi:ABC-type uncharacterized transport system permease subunit
MAASAGARLAKQLRLWRLAGRMDLLFLSRGLRTGVAWYFADLLLGLSGAVWAFLLAERFDGIGPWSREQVVFLLGLALLARSVVDLAFGMNVSFPSRRIGRGQLDHMLLMPQPLWQTIASDGFTPFSGSGQLFAGAAVLGWAAHALALPIDAAWLALLATVCASYGLFISALTDSQVLAGFLTSMPLWLREKLWMGELIKKEVGFDGSLYFPEHHQSHAAPGGSSRPLTRVSQVEVLSA